MDAAQKAERLGSECAHELLDRLLNCTNQGEASATIKDFLVAFGNERSRKFRNDASNGVAVVLADVLLTGVEALKETSSTMTSPIKDIPKQIIHEKGSWQLYEILKRRYCEAASTQREYEVACFRAAEEAEV